MTQLKDAHGVTIRSEEHPLQLGDSFELFSCQVPGTYEGYPNMATPARYTIVGVDGVHGSALTLKAFGRNIREFECSALHVYAILGEWSDYHKNKGQA